jgi:hypothetical protein
LEISSKRGEATGRKFIHTLRRRDIQYVPAEQGIIVSYENRLVNGGC